jgi:GNAT superfamily N-acetyltransferase
MKEQEPIITLNTPSECSRYDLDRFRRMVLEAGEVQEAALDGLIARADTLAFLRVGGAIVGIGALKRPRHQHVRGVFRSAHAKNEASEFNFELGWLVVGKAHRGHSYSRRIVKALVTRAEGQKIYATSITTRIAMHKALIGSNFERAGLDWQSKHRPDERLFLFVHSRHSG